MKQGKERSRQTVRGARLCRRVVYSHPMTPYEDKIWFDAGRRLDAICQDAIDAAADRSNALILAHFKTTLAAVEDGLNARSIEYRSYSPLDLSSLCPGYFDSEPSSIWVGQASHFQARSLSPSEHSRSSMRVLVAEHHPMAPRDQALLDAANSLSCEAQVTYHTSLSDALMMHFGGERLRGLMKQLGMQEQECISHPIISKAIRNAQEKIEKQVQLEVQTMSPEEWFKYNLPQSNQAF